MIHESHTGNNQRREKKNNKMMTKRLVQKEFLTEETEKRCIMTHTNGGHLLFICEINSQAKKIVPLFPFAVVVLLLFLKFLSDEKH